MLPKQNRIPLKKEFTRIKKTGCYLNGGLLTILYSLSPTKTCRFSFIVSNKIDKRATARNRIKRLLREAARNLIPEINQPIDVIVFAKPKISGKSLIEIKKELKTLLTTIGI